jgi:YGGT family
MLRLLLFLDELLNIYLILLFVSAVLSWLIVFNVVNTRRPLVSMVGGFLYRITEPLLKPIRIFQISAASTFRRFFYCSFPDHRLYPGGHNRQFGRQLEIVSRCGRTTTG